MNQITDPPNEYGFGLEFNYAVWTQDTVVTLCNVPWNNDYRDVVKFPDSEGRSLNQFIDAQRPQNIVIEKMSYVSPNVPVRIPTPFNVAYGYNYLRASNPVQPIGGDVQRDYYYFITDVRRINPGTTEIVVQLDVWATFVNQIQFGNCYIERGHIGIANERQFDNNGRNYLTVPEGLDLGGDYAIRDLKQTQIMNNGLDFDVLITSTTSLVSDPGGDGRFGNPPPNMETARGGYVDNIPMGTETYLIQGVNVARYFQAMRVYPWITQGIISAVMIPKQPSSNYNNVARQENYPPGNTGSGASYLNTIAVSKLSFPNITDSNFRESIRRRIPARYRHLRKFETFPYSFIEITSYTGSNMVLKPELVNDTALRLRSALSVIPGSERIDVYALYYNGDELEFNPSNAYLGEQYDQSIVVANFPRLPVVNNMALNAVASQAHSIANARSQADWSQQKALAANQASYDNTNVGLNAGLRSGQIGRGADSAQTHLTNETARQSALIGGLTTMAGGAAGGALAGGPKGAGVGAVAGIGSALVNAVQTNIQTAANTESLGIRSDASRQQDQLGYSTGAQIRDTNRGLADWAARGDYQTTIGAINAKMRDTETVQPSVSSQVGGDFARITDGGLQLTRVTKTVDDSTFRRVGEFWLRYGYAVQQFARIPDSLMVMTKFTYWKLTETYIRAARVTEFHKQTIRGIFEKGVTVWANPDDIGMIDLADNRTVPGVKL